MDKGRAYVPRSLSKDYTPSTYDKSKRYIQNLWKEMA
jgi:hypothetical protein